MVDLFGIRARIKERKWERYEKFKKEQQLFSFQLRFNFQPISSPGKIIDWEQKLVDEIMGKLAEQFDKVCNKQTELMASKPDPRVLNDLRFWERASQFKEIAERVEEQKRLFWDSHELAKKFGFSVREKYSDYLAQE